MSDNVGSRTRTRLLLTGLTAALVLAGTLTISTQAQGGREPQPVPRAECGKGARPETDIQGRVPASDYTSGRVDRGYRCNARPVAHLGASGGFKVHRYVDSQGQVCAFHDNTLVFPRDVVTNLKSGLGVVVLAMDNPKKPRQTATLTTPAMQSPHESLVLNKKRGLLAATLGTAATYPGILDVYDVKTDCRHPRLLSSTPSAVLGHESGFAPDGRTFWALVWTSSTSARVHDRVPGAVPTVLSKLTWPQASIPQSADPFTQDGHDYVLEMDEFVDLFSFAGATDMANAPVGAGRIINVDDPRHPFVVSDIRLEVHQADVHGGEQYADPGANFAAQGYAGHYCSLPKRNNPKIAGCSMIASGLRLFDISDVEHPREVAYFNKPVRPGTRPGFPEVAGAYAMSAPAWDRKRGSVWFTDANSGFYNVQLRNGVEGPLR